MPSRAYYDYSYHQTEGCLNALPERAAFLDARKKCYHYDRGQIASLRQGMPESETQATESLTALATHGKNSKNSNDALWTGEFWLDAIHGCGKVVLANLASTLQGTGSINVDCEANTQYMPTCSDTDASKSWSSNHDDTRCGNGRDARNWLLWGYDSGRQNVAVVYSSFPATSWWKRNEPNSASELCLEVRVDVGLLLNGDPKFAKMNDKSCDDDNQHVLCQKPHQCYEIVGERRSASNPLLCECDPWYAFADTDSDLCRLCDVTEGSTGRTQYPDNPTWCRCYVPWP